MSEILSGSGYQLERRRPGWTDWVMYQVRRFFHWLEDVLSAAGSTVTAFSRVWLVIILAAVLGLAIRLIYIRGGRRDRERGRGGLDGLTSDEEGFGIMISSPAAHKLRAQRALDAGDYRTAFEHVFLMLISELELLKLVAYDRSRTNREYAVQYASRAGDDEAARAMRDATRLFDAKWYGGAACTAGDVTDLDRRADFILERAHRSGTAAH